MPYSGIGDDSLPDNVKKLPEDKRRIWIAAFNAALKTYNGDESRAFATAYAAIKKEYDMEDLEKVGRRHSQTDRQLIHQMRELLAQLDDPDEEPAEKKDVRPEVGGGIDVDKLPASSFVFPESRSFPIATSGDVMDAVHSFGRSKGHSFAEFKKRLIAICRRKGFMDALPENWKKELEKAENLDRMTMDVRRAFDKQFAINHNSEMVEGLYSPPPPYVIEVWDEYVIVMAWTGNDCIYFQASYTKQDDEYVFTVPNTWEQVELVWQPVPRQRFVVQIGKTSDSDEQLVYGVVLKPEPFVDTQGDRITKREIETAAHDFMEESRLFDLFHKDNLPAQTAIPVESYIAPQDLDWNGKIIPAGSWVVVTHITDAEIWKKVRKGEINAYSIKGMGLRREAEV